MVETAICIPTYNSAHHLPRILPPLVSRYPTLVIDSSSKDGSKKIAASLGAKTISIPQSSFNHGLTREMGRKKMKSDIIVMMTPDAYPLHDGVIEELIRPIREKSAALAYARQVSGPEDSFFASFPRRFNYPETSHIRSIEDLSLYGIYTFFFSNSCGAYLSSALDEIGGFEKTEFGEDTIACARLLQRGHKVAYVAEAQVKHTHDYTLREEFIRHKAIGAMRKKYSALLHMQEGDFPRGKLYAKILLREISKTNRAYIPYALCHLAAKWGGYQFGKYSSIQ